MSATSTLAVNGAVDTNAINAIISMNDDDAAIVTVPAKPAKPAKPARATKNATVTFTRVTAIQAASDAGTSMAGAEGHLTNALRAFKKDAEVQAEMLQAFTEAYMAKRLDLAIEDAGYVVALKKWNPKSEDDDEHRTEGQQRVMDTVRVIWHRATTLAGIEKPKTEKQLAAKAKADKVLEERKASKSRLEEVWAVVAPTKKEDLNVDQAMSKLVATMKAFHNSNATKFVGESGQAWRDWLASAPVVESEE